MSVSQTNGSNYAWLTNFKFDSWCSILFAEDAKLWMTDVAPTGTLKKWTESNRITPVGSYISNQVRSTSAILKGTPKHVCNAAGIKNPEGNPPQGRP